MSVSHSDKRPGDEHPENDPELLARQLSETHDHIVLALSPLTEALKTFEFNPPSASQGPERKKITELRAQVAEQSETIKVQRALLVASAELGIDSLTLEVPPQGVAHVRVGTNHVDLPHELGVFLEVLAADGPSDDCLVGWKSSEHIRAELKRRLGKQREIKPHSVDVKTSELRRLFRNAGINPELIMTDPKKGKRLALRRPSSGTTGS